MADDQSKPLPRQCGSSLQFWSTPLTSGQHADITLQGILHLDYVLRLFIENEELELQTQDNRTWTPVQRPYVLCLPTTHTHRSLYSFRGVSPTSEMRVEIQMRSNHSFSAKIRLPSETIDIQALFNEYWSTRERVFTVPSRLWLLTVRLCLMAKRRGRYIRSKVSTTSLVSRITILCEHYRSSLCNCPSRPAKNLRIGGLSALFTP